MKKWVVAGILGIPAVALAAGADHSDPVAAVVLSLALILCAAKLGGDLMMRLGQPAVLGELLVGVVLGNLTLVGLPRARIPQITPRSTCWRVWVS